MPNFEPDPASKLAIQAIAASKDQKAGSVDLRGLLGSLRNTINRIEAAKTAILAEDTKLRSAMTVAFDNESLPDPVPGLGATPTLPSFSSVLSTISTAEAALAAFINKVGTLNELVTITFDGQGVPTDIEY